MKKEKFFLLPKTVQDYLVYVEAVKGRSEKTVEQYANDLNIFFRYIVRYKGLCPASVSDDKIDLRTVNIEFIKTITLSDVYQYVIWLKTVKKNNEATRTKRIVSIRRYFAYLEKNLLITYNPLKDIESPALKKTKPKYLSKDEALLLLRSVDGKNKERDFAILVLFLNCGMRLSELVSINYNDIKADNTLIITGKGNKERTVYLNDICIKAINEYMKVRPNNQVKDRALFLSSRNQRITPRAVEMIVEKYLEKAGLGGRGLSVHKLRHTAATLMYQYGGTDVLVLKEILGHENLATTEIYTHISNEDAKQAVENNPLNIDI